MSKATHRGGRFNGRPRPFHRKRFDHGQPISRMSIAIPALAVSLVALMISITAPVQTHALLLHLPNEASGPTARAYELAGTSYAVVLTKDEHMLFDGEPVHQGQLLTRLTELASVDARSAVIFTPDPDASYDAAVKTLWIILAATEGKIPMCIGGMEKHRDFDFGGTRHWGNTDSSLKLALTIMSDPSLSLPEPESDGFGSCEARALLPPAK